MSESELHAQLLWGIDGGGTKTTILLARHRGNQPPQVLASVRAGSSNVNSRPWEEITADVTAAMHAALESTSLPPQPDAALVAAFAGTGNAAVRDQWQNWFIRKQVAREVRVVDDGEPLIAAGLPDGWGVVLIVGTGSAAFGRSASGQNARAGGWGYLFGDEGSGFAIGRAALRAMTHAYDRKQELTPMLQAIVERWLLSMPRDIVERVYRAPEPRRKIAEVAVVVCELAERGDADAQTHLRSASEELASLIQSVAEQLGLAGSEFPLALSGGVATNSAYLRQAIAEALTKRGLRATPISVVEEPALGCIELARRIVPASRER